MGLNNLTIAISNEIKNYSPDQACFNWCAEQHVVHSVNTGVYSLIFIALTYIMIIMYSVAQESEALKDYQETFIYFAKLFILMFFGYYFIVVKYGLI